MNNVGSFHCLCRPGFEGKLCERGNRVQENIYGLLTKCEVKMAGYWPSSFFCLIMDRDGVEVHKHAKRERGSDRKQKMGGTLTTSL